MCVLSILMAAQPTLQQELIYRLYADYGRAVLGAQRFEINLGIILLFLDGRRQAILKKPAPQDVDALLDEIDGKVVGELLRRLGEHHVPNDPETIELFHLAARNRNTLVHHFMKEEVPDLTIEALDRAIGRVEALEGPISRAKRAAEDLALQENARMQAEIETRRT